MNKIQKNQLKVACRFLGGIKPVAAEMEINQGNLSRWLNGEPTLGDDKIVRLLKILGLPNGKPSHDRVHVWSITRVAFLDITPGLALYFPYGAKICRAPWVNLGMNIKDSFGIGTVTENLYAISDGHTRAVLRVPRAKLLQKENYKNFLKWKNSTDKNSVLNIPKITREWETGIPSVEEFDRAWGGWNLLLQKMMYSQ